MYTLYIIIHVIMRIHIHCIVQNNVSKLYEHIIDINCQLPQTIKKKHRSFCPNGTLGGYSAFQQHHHRLNGSETTSSLKTFGGSLSTPKALRRRQANSPVRSFPHKALQLMRLKRMMFGDRDGRGQEEFAKTHYNCQDEFVKPNPVEKWEHVCTYVEVI